MPDEVNEGNAENLPNFINQEPRRNDRKRRYERKPLPMDNIDWVEKIEIFETEEVKRLNILISETRQLKEEIIELKELFRQFVQTLIKNVKND